MKLLLHACCGPCSLEPVRLLAQQGHEISVYFANANIQPRAEYERRLEALRAWAESEGLAVIEGSYDADAWNEHVGALEEAGADKEERCRACYRLRLEASARYAASHGFEALSTTLAVSPYQYSEACHEELEAACARHGLACIWEDFRPYYPQATVRSRNLGMYRQNYCGCRYSRAEAAAEREQRLREKQAAAQKREAELDAKRKQRAARQAQFEARKQARHNAKMAAKAALNAPKKGQQMPRDGGWRG